MSLDYLYPHLVYKNKLVGATYNHTLGELMCKDALEREESCGGHFREESQTKEGEALRNDADYTFVSAWEYAKKPSESNLHKEDLKFENIEVKQRSYK